ncbi:MAG: hypothetical protein JO257_31140, partial [Deltaproteobacteria bacterium]|nr:hypothetical protein [Deltaproteobacteria bacterium]
QCGASDIRKAMGPDNAKFDKACSGYSITKVTVPMTIGFGLVAIGGIVGYMVTQKHNEEHSSSVVGRREHKPSFMVIPVVSPEGGGATFRMEW